VAKVVRDTIMIENALLYPNYGFEKHVGYGTELHRKQLSLHGISNIHRLSFKPVSLIAQNTF
jgi:ribonuclease HII